MNRDEYWFWLYTTPDIFREDMERFFKVFQTPQEVYEADTRMLLADHLISERQKVNLDRSKRSQEFRKAMEQMQKDGIRFVHRESEDFPEKLKQIPDAPYGLFVRGNLPDPDMPSVGMVGARACSEYGKKSARKFAHALAAGGVQIISGMAIGIDSESAKGALAAQGRTFAVLGSGVDVIYPLSNLNLYYEICATGGGVISEYPLGTPAVAWQFPMRNRLISGLSDRLLVMEAKERSGTLITVRYALEQGRDVYALPGRISDKNSEGCNQMIADGAGILLSPALLLEEIRKPKGAGRRLLFTELLQEALLNPEAGGESNVSEEELAVLNPKAPLSAAAESGTPLGDVTDAESPLSDSSITGIAQSSNLRSEEPEGKSAHANAPQPATQTLSQKLLSLMDDDPISAQTLVKKSGESPERAGAALAELELAGLIEEVSKNMYVKII